jgi:ArsR family transcriptional regulator
MDMQARVPILEQFSALADGTRSRLMLVLERQELTVSELCAVLQLPQSTVSRHLKTLVAGGWVASRPDGTRRIYRLRNAEGEQAPRTLWGLARDEVARTPAAREDERRLEGVLASRRRRSQEFFASAARDWDQVRDELFGAHLHGTGLLALLDETWCVADLGCGTGSVAASLAPFVHRVLAVDESRAMLEAAQERLAQCDNVELRRGRLEAVPIEDGTADAATLVLVLHHVADPVAVLCEAARVLRPGAPLVILDMLPHDREEYQEQMGHVWMGFSEQQLHELARPAGLELAAFAPLPVDVAARGPGLFAARARKRLDRRDDSKHPRSDPGGTTR